MFHRRRWKILRWRWISVSLLDLISQTSRGQIKTWVRTRLRVMNRFSIRVNPGGTLMDGRFSSSGRSLCSQVWTPQMFYFLHRRQFVAKHIITTLLNYKFCFINMINRGLKRIWFQYFIMQTLLKSATWSIAVSQRNNEIVKNKITKYWNSMFSC